MDDGRPRSRLEAALDAELDMPHAQSELTARSAVIVRPPVKSAEPEQYLALTPQGSAFWTIDLAAATAFGSMREATRAALHLRGELRAFGLPLSPEQLSLTLH